MLSFGCRLENKGTVIFFILFFFSQFSEIFHYVLLKIDVSVTCGNFETRFVPLFSGYRSLDTTQKISTFLSETRYSRIRFCEPKKNHLSKKNRFVAAK